LSRHGFSGHRVQLDPLKYAFWTSAGRFARALDNVDYLEQARFAEKEVDR
jgi:hypothetical protein